MQDLFNLNTINKNVIELTRSCADVSHACETYVTDPNDGNGEYLVEIMEILEKNMLHVKDNVVRMINMMEGKDDINVKKSDNGYEIET